MIFVSSKQKSSFDIDLEFIKDIKMENTKMISEANDNGNFYHGELNKENKRLGKGA